ncbi:MFS transporter [Teichococcus rhizosphaerae]|uniref:MFS transporter n=1 Tax=Teichococcus rhizosphaerae TaxID=1335062 RepID=UPI001FE99691|nr:MFS transporter [Pseudoroseomonas rhizosphaerae]
MPSSRSQRGLDWLNFFAADVQTGFGPFIAVYLAANSWTEAQIGLALSLGTLTAMAGQVPAGAAVDAMRNKRLVAALALGAIAASAVLLALRADFWPVMASEVLHGVASAVLVPALAAISLAMVGRNALSQRLGRNGRYASLGNASAAAVLGLMGAYVSSASVFWLTAALTLPALAALYSIRSADMTERVRRIQSRGSGEGGLRRLLTKRGVLVFAGVCCLFTAANARCCRFPAPWPPTSPAARPT